MIQFDSAKTTFLLGYPSLIRTLEDVLRQYQRNEIVSPERLAVPCGNGRGILLSMPCVASDVTVHKLITVYKDNPGRGLPAINGHVVCCDSANGIPLFCLDGPTVTARRTAAISMIGINYLRPRPPEAVLLIGTGAQAEAHALAALELFPHATIHVQGRTGGQAEAFCARLGSRSRLLAATAGAQRACEVVIAVTSSLAPVYDEAADPDRLVIGVGAYRLDMVELGARTLRGSRIFVDDMIGARGEAGDLVAAGIDWQEVTPLASALAESRCHPGPVVLKTVGCAAWDLAACRAARSALAAGQDAHGTVL